jgi:hypothetical protein
LFDAVVPKGLGAIAFDDHILRVVARLAHRRVFAIARDG